MAGQETDCATCGKRVTVPGPIETDTFSLKTNAALNAVACVLSFVMLPVTVVTSLVSGIIGSVNLGLWVLVLRVVRRERYPQESLLVLGAETMRGIRGECSVPQVMKPGLFWVMFLAAVWRFCFMWPSMGTSWLWHNARWSRWVVLIVGFPHALLAGEYWALVGSFGDWEGRRFWMEFAYVWPYSWPFLLLRAGKSLTARQMVEVGQALGNAAIPSGPR